VVLVEAGPRLLAQFPPDLGAKAQRQLEGMGVEVRANTRVKNVTQGCVEVDGEVIHAENIIWGAGVSATPLTRKLGVELDRAGRVNVNPDLSVPGHAEVFAIGDMAFIVDKDGQTVPGVSPAAIQMAKHVAKIIRNDICARPGEVPAHPPFDYWDKGMMATIGRSAAVAKIKNFKFVGFTAWAAWLMVHLIFLIGFRNKIAVLFNWAYSYFTYKRGMRIITGISDDPGREVERSLRQEPARAESVGRG
jgi:NADH dehydrogenase